MKRVWLYLFWLLRSEASVCLLPVMVMNGIGGGMARFRPYDGVSRGVTHCFSLRRVNALLCCVERPQRILLHKEELLVSGVLFFWGGAGLGGRYGLWRSCNRTHDPRIPCASRRKRT
ncbi:hypothetical protein B0J12DRAFT_203519 [Macrophomina phaseolina]|uniref:Secreted protein n=1 Tax=Macrophomina phaseolina TaxID=35725 RepID=A0ABQ8G219_9PEZI|nr:hypothetical protein B0J12DRAFT_203519 [Macrophomina phaseolina]